MSPNSFVDWGKRLPSYYASASADNSSLRARHSFEWAMISDGGMVVTDEDWEIDKGLCSRPVIEAMDVPALLERGFSSNHTNVSLLRLPSCVALVASPPARPFHLSGPCASLLRAFTGGEVRTARTLRAPPRSGALTLWCGQS